MPYPVAACRGHIPVNASVPWYLEGGVSAVNCIAAYQPKGAADLATSYINLANPGTYNAAPGSAPSFNTSTGWTFNGLANYLTCGVVPNRGWSALVRFADMSAPNERAVIGRYEANKRFEIEPSGKVYSAGGLVTIAPQATAGVMGISGGDAYFDGSDIGDIPAGSGTSTNPVYIGARYRADLGGSADVFASGKIYAVAIYDTALTPAQMLAISTAMAAL